MRTPRALPESGRPDAGHGCAAGGRRLRRFSGCGSFGYVWGTVAVTTGYTTDGTTACDRVSGELHTRPDSPPTKAEVQPPGSGPRADRSQHSFARRKRLCEPRRRAPRRDGGGAATVARVVPSRSGVCSSAEEEESRTGGASIRALPLQFYNCNFTPFGSRKSRRSPGGQRS